MLTGKSGIDNPHRTEAEAGLKASLHLSRPGPQAWNQIGTLRQMLALARTPRPTPEQEAQASFAGRVEKIVRRVLVEELPPAVEYIIRSRQGGQNGKA